MIVDRRVEAITSHFDNMTIIFFEDIVVVCMFLGPNVLNKIILLLIPYLSYFLFLVRKASHIRMATTGRRTK